MTEFEVTPQEFSLIREWSALHESQFMSLMYNRWPMLRNLPPGAEVKIVVLWNWKADYSPSHSIARKWFPWLREVGRTRGGTKGGRS